MEFNTADITFNNAQTSIDINNHLANHDNDNLANDLNDGIGVGMQHLNHSKQIISIFGRMNQFMTVLHTPESWLTTVLQCDAIIIFKLISTVLLSLYRITQLVSDPDPTDHKKCVQLGEAHTILILAVVAMCCQTTAMPIAFVLSSYDWLQANVQFYNAYRAVYQLDPQAHDTDSKDFKKARNKHIKSSLNLLGLCLLLSPSTLPVGIGLLLTVGVVAFITQNISTKNGKGASQESNPAEPQPQPKSRGRFFQENKNKPPTSSKKPKLSDQLFAKAPCIQATSAWAYA